MKSEPPGDRRLVCFCRVAGIGATGATRGAGDCIHCAGAQGGEMAGRIASLAAVLSK
jgi:hypothetical protein